MKKFLKFLFVIVVIIAIGIFGYKYYNLYNNFSTTNAELAEYKLASLPPIEKNASLTTDAYFNYILQDKFVANYKLKLDGNTKLHFRDCEIPPENLPIAKNYGCEFSIAYVEKNSEGEHIICFAIPYTDSTPETPCIKYMYVTVEEISAELPKKAASGEFVKIIP